MKNNIYTVDYKKHFSKDGTVYTQTITRSKELADRFNAYRERELDEIKKHFLYTNDDLKALAYLEELNTSAPTFATLTTLEHFKNFYIKNIYTPPKKDRQY